MLIPKLDYGSKATNEKKKVWGFDFDINSNCFAGMNSKCSMDQLGGQLGLLLDMHRLFQRNVSLLALVMVVSRYVRSFLAWPVVMIFFSWKRAHIKPIDY